MKHRVEDIAESCAGVRDIDNRIRVATGNSSLSSPQRGATTASGSLGGQSTSSSSSLGSASAGSDDAARLASSTTTAKAKDASSTRTGASGTTGSSSSQH
jgi:hypothetical protein